MKKKKFRLNLEIIPWEKLYKYLSSVLFGFVFFVVFLMILSNFSIGGLRVLTVLTGSMEPAIKTGSVIFITPSESYEVNDVVTFRSQGEDELITHRIVQVDDSVEERQYWTKGDANDVPDSYKLPQAGIFGKVRFQIPLIGYLIEYIKKPVGLILLVIIPATIIIYSEIQKIRSEVKKLKEDRKKKRRKVKKKPKRKLKSSKKTE